MPLSGNSPRLLPAGSSALLIEPADARSVVDLYLRLRASRPAGVIDLVPAAATILVSFDPTGVPTSAIAAWVDAVATRVDAVATRLDAVATGADAVATRMDGVSTDAYPSPGAAGAAATSGAFPHADADSAGRPPEAVLVEVAVRYDGPDLAVVAELCGASVDRVIAAHLEQLWTAAFIGFAPGFAYLRGEDDRLSVPRREIPRAVVPAGSVGLAAGYCGIYPRESPGGWHLIGHTDAVLWDATRTEPALLTPGARVRFVRER